MFVLFYFVLFCFVSCFLFFVFVFVFAPDVSCFALHYVICRLKCHFNNDIRVVRITNKMLFVRYVGRHLVQIVSTFYLHIVFSQSNPITRARSLKDRLENDFGFHVILKYKDTDGDMINLDNQNDLNELIETETGSVTVCRCAQFCVRCITPTRPSPFRCRYLKHLEPHQWAGHLALQ